MCLLAIGGNGYAASEAFVLPCVSALIGWSAKTFSTCSQSSDLFFASSADSDLARSFNRHHI